LLRLGAFEDVRTSDGPSGNLEIGFEIELSSTELSGPFMTPSARLLRRYISGPDTGEARSLALDLSYNTSPKFGERSAHSTSSTSLTPVLTNAEFKTSLTGSRDTKGEAYVSFTTGALPPPALLSCD
jgi:hypothetical protein